MERVRSRLQAWAVTAHILPSCFTSGTICHDEEEKMLASHNNDTPLGNRSPQRQPPWHGGQGAQPVVAECLSLEGGPTHIPPAGRNSYRFKFREYLCPAELRNWRVLNSIGSWEVRYRQLGPGTRVYTLPRLSR